MANSRAALLKNIDSLIMTVTEMPNSQSRMSDGRAAFVIGFHAFLSEKKAALLNNDANAENDAITKAIAENYMAFSTRMLTLLSRLDKLDFLIIDTKIAIKAFDSEKRSLAFDKFRQILLKCYDYKLLSKPSLFVEVKALESMAQELCEIDKKAQTANANLSNALDQKSLCIKHYRTFYDLFVNVVNNAYVIVKDPAEYVVTFKTISDQTKQIFNQQPLDVAALELAVAEVDKIYAHLCDLLNKGKTRQEIMEAFNLSWKKYQASPTKADAKTTSSADPEDEFLKNVAALEEWSEPHAGVIKQFKEEVKANYKLKEKLTALKAKYAWYKKVNDAIVSIINLQINFNNQSIQHLDVITYDFINEISWLYKNTLPDAALASTIKTKYAFYLNIANLAKLITTTPRNNPLPVMNAAIDGFKNKIYNAYKANNIDYPNQFKHLLTLNQLVTDFLNDYPVHIKSSTDTQTQTNLKAMVIAIINTQYENDISLTPEKLTSFKNLLDDFKEFSRLFHALARQAEPKSFVFLAARKDCQQLYKLMQKIEVNLTAKQFDCLVAEIERLRNNAERAPKKKKIGKLGAITLQNPLAKLINKEFFNMITADTAKTPRNFSKNVKLLLAFIAIAVVAIACGFIFGYAAPLALAASLNPGVAMFGAWLVKIGTAAVVALATTAALTVIGAVGALIASVYHLTHAKKPDAANSKVSNSQASIGKGLPKVAGKNQTKKNAQDEDAEISDAPIVNDSSTLVDDDLDWDDKPTARNVGNSLRK